MPTGKKPLGRPRSRWKVNNRIDLKEMSVDGRKLIYLTEDRDYFTAVLNVLVNLKL